MREAHEEEEERNQELFEGLIEAIKQEELHPGLLGFEKRTFEGVKEVVGEQRTKLKEYLRNEGEEEGKLSRKNFRYMVYSAEIEKVDYLLKMYLKIRLKKVRLRPRSCSSTASTCSRTSRRPRRSCRPPSSSSSAPTPRCATTTTRTTSSGTS